jgi:ABC-2 type transport system permease protein
MKLLLITYYKIKMMLSDKMLFSAMIIIPLLITFATGYALRYEKSSTVNISIVDEDNTTSSKELVLRMKKNEGINIKTYSREKALSMLEGNQLEAVFIIKEGYEENILTGQNSELIDMAKAPLSISSEYIKVIMSGYVMRRIAENEAVQQVSKLYRESRVPLNENIKKEISDYYNSQWEPKPLMTVNYMEMEKNVETIVKSVSLPPSTATGVGLIVIFIMFYILFGSSWLIEERLNGTIKRLVSGQSALGYSFAGSILALFFSAVFQVILFSAFMRFVFNIILFFSIWSYIIMAIYIFAVISISMLLSSILKTPQQLQATAPVFALLTGFAGGCFWNFVDLSKQARQLSVLTPEGWVLRGINRLLTGSGLNSEVMLSIGVLAAITLVLLPVSYLIIKRQVVN